MLARLGTFLVRRRRTVLVASLLVAVLAGVFGSQAPGLLGTGGFADPNAESTRASDALAEVFETGEPNLILLVTATEGSVDDPATAAAGMALTEELAAEDGVMEVVSYWSLFNAPPLRSGDGSQALVLARLAGEEGSVPEATQDLVDRYTREDGPISIGVGGAAPTYLEIQHTIESDLQRSEAIALPITLVLLIGVFGGLVAALLPLAVGVVAVLGTLLILRVLAGVTDVSIFALNLTTALGLGLAIDYSLFIVSRYREELGAGYDPHTAVIRTVRTAGRTVLFAAATVAVSLAALLIFPLGFLRSMAYAGIGVVAFAALASVVMLPALLAVIGRRIDAIRLPGLRVRTGAEGTGFWHRVATTVMRRPIPIAAVVMILLVFLGLPFLRAEFGSVDDRVLPVDSPTRQVADEIRSNFASNEAAALEIVVPDLGSAGEAEITAYATALSTLEGAARVDASTGSFIGGQQVVGPNAISARYAADGATWLALVPSVEPLSPKGAQLVADVRAVDAPFDALVGGVAAADVDAKESVFTRVPLATALIAAVTFAALFLMFGSLLVPVKALVLNLLSLSATFGAMVWIFQEGNWSGALNFTATGTLDVTTPILMFCIAFGLSMDYEVFLLSRIKEQYDLTGDNEQAVAMGLERTGRIVTAAASLLAVVFVAFAFSGISFIKLLGVGLALAVVMDATLVRATLVPAFMKLAGRANWWAPRPLRRLYERVGISEGGHLEDEPIAERAPTPVG